MSRTLLLATICLAAVLAACGPTEPYAGNDHVNGNNNSNQGWPDAGAPTTCAEHAKYVYVLDSDDTLYRFNPQVANLSAFTAAGPVSCGAALQPNSMSVGRDGFAYALFGDYDASSSWICDGVYRVDLQTGACLNKTPFECGTAGFNKFGMGFATLTPGATEDRLFIANADTTSLGMLDIANGAVQTLGNLANMSGEFTGNANAELWGFFPFENPPAAILVNKDTGASLVRRNLPGLQSLQSGFDSYAFAFAFWGGAFYIFYQVTPPDSSTNVWKLDLETGLELYIPDTGLRIVGAGVSTCAPVTVL